MLLDQTGRVCLNLWPLAQVVAPTERGEAELFLFDGRGLMPLIYSQPCQPVRLLQ
jgi:hypothetical protein